MCGCWNYDWSGKIIFFFFSFYCRLFLGILNYYLHKMGENKKFGIYDKWFFKYGKRGCDQLFWVKKNIQIYFFVGNLVTNVNGSNFRN